MIFIDNKYTRWYYRIISQAQQRPVPNSHEKHHIIPKCLGGTNARDNLVTLTAREHFICHLLLCNMISGQNRYKMLSAVTRFRQSSRTNKRVLTSWEYQKIREYAILARTGVKHTDKSIQKIKDKHHDVSGSNNPRARHIRAISPNGVVYQLHGTLKKFCKENGLGYSTVLRMLSIHDKWRKTFKGSTEGWSFTHLD